MPSTRWRYVSCCVFEVHTSGMRISRIVSVVSILVICVFARAAEPATTQSLPTLYIIGDSTVHNTDAKLMGWGDCITPMFDTSKIIMS